MRSDTVSTDELVRRALKLESVDVGGAPANYSIRLGASGSARGPRELALLYRSTCLVARASTAAELVRVLASELSDIAARDDGRVRVRASALIAADGRATVIVPPPPDELARHERMLAQRGFRVLRSPTVPLDPASGEVVVGAPVVEVDEGALGGVPEASGGSGGTGTAEPGRYPIGRWVFTNASGYLDPLPASRGLRLVLDASVDRHPSAADAVVLAHALSGATSLAAGSVRSAALVKAVLALPS